MANIDTAIMDDGSADSIINDIVSPLNEMALGWFSAVSGKGLVRTPGVVAGVTEGTTTVRDATPVLVAQTPLASPYGGPTLGSIVLIGIVVVVAILLVK